MCHIVCCTTKIRNSSAKVQQFFEKNNIPFVFMTLYDKKRHPIWDIFFVLSHWGDSAALVCFAH